MATNHLPDIKFQEREDLIAALKARRSWAKQYDAKRLHDHKDAEKAALDSFRKRCKELAAMSYAEVVALDRKSYSEFIKFKKPDCPSALLPKLDEILRTVEISQQKQFTFRPGETVHHILTFDENVKTEMC